MLKIEGLKKSFQSELGSVKEVFRGLNFSLEDNDFVSIIGSNGAGKSTLLNTIMGNIIPDEGSIDIDGRDITTLEKHKRNAFISKVYQNPSLGTSPSMTVFENLSMADNKGKKFGFSLGLNKKRKEYYRSVLAELNLGIEDQLDTEVGLLSGGQRQSLALIMATLNNPEVLLLDEHTAALDPKTSEIIMEKTREVVEKNNIPTLMITHNLTDAIKYGNRLIMLHQGRVVLDIRGDEKQGLTPEKLLKEFHKNHAEMTDNDLFSMG